jgi:hypothetical protein
LTKSKSFIKTEIENELSLYTFFEKFKNNNKSQGGLYIDNYSGPEPEKHIPKFCPAAKRCLNEKNGGAVSSITSEALCIQYFFERFSASRFLLELEVEYHFHWKMVDVVCNIYGNRIGISTTRAMRYGPDKSFSEEKAEDLLKKKLHGLIMARNCVSEKHKFNTVFLHVFAETQFMAEQLKKVYPKIIKEDESGTFSEVVIIVTVYTRRWLYDKKEAQKFLGGRCAPP